MEIITAKTAGFCFGVSRAVNKVYELLEAREGQIFTLGPIIHNEEVVSDLEAKGVYIVEEEELDSLKEGTVVIRSHGVGKKVYDRIRECGLVSVDVTCPYVLKIHKNVAKQSENGKSVIIIGDPKHPEVLGIQGWCSGEVHILKDLSQAQAFVPEKGKTYFVVVQTTFNRGRFEEIRSCLLEKAAAGTMEVLDTICSATTERQKEAAELAASMEAMVVVGGSNSSNTRKLYEICKAACGDTILIRTREDIPEGFGKDRNIGITAGASTPHKSIREVEEALRGMQA